MHDIKAWLPETNQLSLSLEDKSFCHFLNKPQEATDIVIDFDGDLTLVPWFTPLDSSGQIWESDAWFILAFSCYKFISFSDFKEMRKATMLEF